MSPDREAELQKHTLNLYCGDYAKLQQLYPDIGASRVIRRVVRKFIEQVEHGTDGFDPKVEVKI